MKIGVCTSVENAGLVRDAGFAFLEENIQNLLVPEQPDDAFAPKLKAVRNAGLPVPVANCFLPGALKCVGPDVDEKRLDAYATSAFRRAHEAGISLLVFGSGGARNIPDGFSHEKAREQFVAYVRRIAPIAEAQNVIILVECLNRKECNFLNALTEGAAVVEEVNHPHVRLLADIYHMSVENESPSEIIKHGHLIQHIHVAEKEGRQAPGTSGEDFGPFLSAIKEINYRGDLSFECGWKNLSEQAAGSLKSFREQVRQAGLA
jgi:sugar phosphate isomerase/epimerase